MVWLPDSLGIQSLSPDSLSHLGHQGNAAEGSGAPQAQGSTEPQ